GDRRQTRHGRDGCSARGPTPGRLKPTPQIATKAPPPRGGAASIRGEFDELRLFSDRGGRNVPENLRLPRPRHCTAERVRDGGRPPLHPAARPGGTAAGTHGARRRKPG